ncbi:hypothetical protein PCG10_009937 [Penicillium crustosum]|uniref:Uncharacterized protein n=1 Tax=Penicillium crustosum TaxID=36656 RepID=A0A9P5KWB3_PENCR|nr:hypothetical protein PCG10_009937 [Penicillium crustosum]
MPSPLHDVFCAKIVEEISRQLKQFQGSEDPSATFANEVEHLATSRIMIPDEIRDGKQSYSKREPDASFKHRRARYPGVIIEVCYSQKSQRVSHLADEYILNTDGSVNAVIALDVDYKGSKKATITVWRPEYTTVDGIEELQATAVVEALPFRADSGIPVEATALRLSLWDFATEDLSRDYVTFSHALKKNREHRHFSKVLPIDYGRVRESVVGLRLPLSIQVQKRKDQSRRTEKVNVDVSAATFVRTRRSEYVNPKLTLHHVDEIEKRVGVHKVKTGLNAENEFLVDPT